MGIYDRDYYQDDRRRSWGGHSMVITLILINVGVYLADTLFLNGRLTDVDSYFVLRRDVMQRPWELWRFITYGFLHDSHSLQHIVLNMFGLWFFGSDVEGVYGRRQFLRMYLTGVVAAGAIWLLVETIVFPGGRVGAMFGASGGVMTLMMLFVLHFPHRTILFMGFLPMPAWVMGAIYVLMDVGPLLTRHVVVNGPQIAYAAHLGGALYGYFYYRTHWHLLFWLPDQWNWGKLKRKFSRKPKLKVHNEPDNSEIVNLPAEVDRILEKISRSGEASLTSAERRTLEAASERYKQRRR